MDVYDYIEQMKDWAGDEKNRHYSDAEEAAKRYVRGINPNLFDSILTGDFETLLDTRNKADDMAAFANIDLETGDSKPTAEAVFYRRLKKIIGEFVKAVIKEVEEHDFCSPEQIEFWRSRYNVKLAGLPEYTPNATNAPLPVRGRESLYKRKVTVRANEFATVISQLIENGILLRTENDTDIKIQNLFKAFLIGAGEYEVSRFGRGDRMTVNNTNRFAYFIDCLNKEIKDKDESLTKGKLWDLVQDWFQDEKGNPFKGKSLNVSGTRGRDLYEGDLTINEIAIKLANMITQ